MGGSTQDVHIVVESSGDVGPQARAHPLASAGQRRIRFPYIPTYLFYVLVEVLKNSSRATVEKCKDFKQRTKERPIVITVGANPSHVGIRIDDLAGGIPFQHADRVWSYMYTTASQSQGTKAFSEQGTPLAGYGVGLPLSRLYARYLGGSLNLMSLPGIGTSAYLHLKRIGTEAREEIPSSVQDSTLST